MADVSTVGAFGKLMNTILNDRQGEVPAVCESVRMCGRIEGKVQYIQEQGDVKKRVHAVAKFVTYIDWMNGITVVVEDLGCRIDEVLVFAFIIGVYAKAKFYREMV